MSNLDDYPTTETPPVVIAETWIGPPHFSPRVVTYREPSGRYRTDVESRDPEFACYGFLTSGSLVPHGVVEPAIRRRYNAKQQRFAELLSEGLT